MSLLGVIGAFQTGTYTVSRYAAGSWANGVYTKDASPTTFPIDASTQPLEGDKLEAIPESERGFETRQLWTATALQTTDDASGTPADTISIDSRTWKVIRVSYHGVLSSFYYAVIARQS